MITLKEIIHLLASIDDSKCTPEDKETVIKAISILNKAESMSKEIDDIKSGLGYMNAKIEGLKKQD